MKLLSVLAAVCMLFIFLINFVWGNSPEYFKYGKETGDVINSLSIGFISAYIFYIIDVWYPELKERKKVHGRIAMPLSRILNDIKSPIVAILDTYGNGGTSFDDIKKEDFINIINKVDLVNDEGPMMTQSLEKLSYGQYLYHEVERINNFIMQINELPINIDSDLIVILDKIRNSTYHEVMGVMNRRSSLTFNNPTSKVGGETISSYYYEYYLLFFELKKYMKNNKVDITIKNI